MKNILSKFTKPKKPKVPKLQYRTGLDIGSYSIKVCVVKEEEGSRELVAYAIVPINNSNEKEAIQKAIASTKLELKSIKISSGTQGVVTRQITLPKMTMQEISQALKFEVEKYIPYKIDEVILDFQILDPDIGNNKMSVLLAAAKKDIIEKRMALMKELGLKIDVIDVDILSLTNAFNCLIHKEESGGKASVLLNIGEAASSLAILKDGLPYISREISIAGRDFTKRISDTLSINISEAEALKHNAQDKYQEMISACEQTLNELCSQIRMSFDYFENQVGSAVENIYLSGGASRLKGLDKALENLLGGKVSLWGDFHDLNLNSSIDKSKFLDDIGCLSVALGLALR